MVQSAAPLVTSKRMTIIAFPRLGPLVLLALLGGCATGYAQDWFRQRNSIMTPQLLRYGLDLTESRCVAERLSRRLSRQNLARLQERAAVVQPVGAAALTLANLRAVATAVGGRAVEGELSSSAIACNVAPARLASAEPMQPIPAPAPAGEAATPTATAAAGEPSQSTTPSSNPVDIAAFEAAGRANGELAMATTPALPTTSPGTWLNLGAAASGQSIAIDAASILQEGATRIAWFRMTDPQSGTPTANRYRLKVDCAARTIQPLAMRQVDAQGAQVALRIYNDDDIDAHAGPAESGTVLEIAFLSLCT
jgi:hypothetical protein